MAKRIVPFIEPLIGQAETEAVTKYMSSGGWLTEFKKTRELEDRICGFLGVKHCFMYPNCTLALYAACEAMNVGRWQDVLVPDFTMVASANAVQMTGAYPLLVDVDIETLCLDIDKAEKEITAYTRGIMPVALNGRSYDYLKLLNLAKKHTLFVIEDAAQAFGSCFSDGTPIGTIGDIGCFSFSPHKIITTGQGGCAVTNDDNIAKRLRTFRNFGRKSSGGYDHDAFGINLKFTDLHAVIGIEQIKQIDERIEKKRRITERYENNLDDYLHIDEQRHKHYTPWYVDVFLEERDKLASFLLARGVHTQKFYPSLHWLNEYKSQAGPCMFPNSTMISEQGLWLPSSLTLSDDDIDYVCEKIIEFQKGQ